MDLPVPPLRPPSGTGDMQLQFARYRNGKLRVEMMDDDGPYATPSLNLVEAAELLGELQFFVKKNDPTGDAPLKGIIVPSGQPGVFELVPGFEVPFGNHGQVASVWQVTESYRAAVAELAGIELEQPESSSPRVA